LLGVKCKSREFFLIHKYAQISANFFYYPQMFTNERKFFISTNGFLFVRKWAQISANSFFIVRKCSQMSANFLFPQMVFFLSANGRKYPLILFFLIRKCSQMSANFLFPQMVFFLSANGRKLTLMFICVYLWSLYRLHKQYTPISLHFIVLFI